jgi:hypothetical protein
VSEQVERLLDEFVVRFRRGESPNLREYLTRAGGDADRLARLVDAFLESVPPPPATEERLALSRAWVESEPALLALRRERGLRRGDVVDALRSRLGLSEEKKEKLRLRYHELETGQLEPAGVDRRVWEVLAELFRTRAEELVEWARPPGLAAPRLVFYRRDEVLPAAETAAPWVPTEEPDEVDALFGVGRTAH